MDCSEFLSRFSDLYDGIAPPEERELLETHLGSCARCRSYREAVERSVGLLRSLPRLDLPPDFRPRLSHRIFHLEDGAAIARQSMGSGATTVAVLVVAVVMAAAAWSHLARGRSAPLELPAVVVTQPPELPSLPAVAHRTLRPQISPFAVQSVEEPDFWGDPHALLFQYSPFSRGSSNGSLVRVGIQ